jgi:hypothetical protein
MRSDRLLDLFLLWRNTWVRTNVHVDIPGVRLPAKIPRYCKVIVAPAQLLYKSSYMITEKLPELNVA